MERKAFEGGFRLRPGFSRSGEGYISHQLQRSLIENRYVLLVLADEENHIVGFRQCSTAGGNRKPNDGVTSAIPDPAATFESPLCGSPSSASLPSNT